MWWIGESKDEKDMSGQAAQVDSKLNFWQALGNRVARKTWPLTSKIAYWVYGFVVRCDSPEYFMGHPKLVRWTGGLKIFCWTHVCGHGLIWSLHMGNIYWRIGHKSQESTKHWASSD